MDGLIRLLMNLPDLDIRRDGEGAVIYRHEQGHWPEDYIAVEQRPGGYAVCEAHRAQKTDKAFAHGEEEAAVLAAALGLHMFLAVADPDADRQIRGSVEQGCDDQAARFLANRLDPSLYSIGKEDPSRISLVKKGQKADVLFAGRPIVQGAPIPRAYVVLYHYGRILGEARGLAAQAGVMGIPADPQKILCLCVSGDGGLPADKGRGRRRGR